MNYTEICNQVCDLVKIVSTYIKEARASLNSDEIHVKGKNDFVTDIDKGSEKRLVDGLSAILPEAGFIAEEQTSTKHGKHYNWIIDPIDGTTNFIHGLSPNAISIALIEDDELCLGVVMEMGLNELFYATKGGKAYCNGIEIHVSKTRTIAESLIATGFPYSDFSRIDNYIATMRHLMQNSIGLRRIGSAATDLVYTACGRFDSFFEQGLSPWDVAAGAFIVQQAGGMVSDFNNGKNFLFGREIVATNSLTHNEFVEITKKMM